MGLKTIGWIVVALAIIAVGWWLLASPQGSNMQTGATTSSTDTGASMNSGASASRQTFRSIFAQTGDYQCVYEQVGTSTRSTNTVDIADGKMRGEFRTVAGDKVVNDLMVYDGSYLYTWVEGATTGKRTVLHSIADLPDAIPTDLTSAAIFGTSQQNVSWDCHPWAKDSSQLMVPTYVTFK